jgi:hypothetical protein
MVKLVYIVVDIFEKYYKFDNSFWSWKNRPEHVGTKLKICVKGVVA